jgi:hypothetical protein
VALDQVQADSRVVDVVEVVVFAETGSVAVGIVQGSAVQIAAPGLENSPVENQVRQICRLRSVAPC